MILSGMSNMEQLQENIRTFEEEKPLNEEEKAALFAAARNMTRDYVAPCMACRYCVSHCPQGLGIPYLLSLFNEHSVTGGGFIAPMVIGTLPEDKRLDSCIGCRSCEAVCPQRILISEAMADFAAQQVLADVISGVMLSWSRPFNIGEKMVISSLGISGVVEDLTVRHTVIRTYCNSRMIIPNSVINKAIMENSNYNNDYIGSYMEIPVRYRSNLERFIEIITRIVESHPLVIDIREDQSQDSKVTVLVKELGMTGAVLKCTVWTQTLDDNFTACSQIKEEFDAAGIEMYQPVLPASAPAQK